jgi:hypothetical protein
MFGALKDAFPALWNILAGAIMNCFEAYRNSIRFPLRAIAQA